MAASGSRSLFRSYAGQGLGGLAEYIQIATAKETLAMSRAIATDAAKMRAAGYTSLLAVLAAVSGTASADNLPGDYAPYPTGTRIVGLHYKYASGGELRAGGDLVDENFDAVDQQGVLTFNYYGGQRLRWLANASLPFGRTEIDSDLLGLHDTSTGIGDPYFVVGVVPVIRDKYSIGVSGWLFVPLGEYSADKAINQGMNVWSARAEGNVTFRPSAAWSLELTMGVRAFEDNDEFGPTHATLERSPRFLIESHLVRNVRPELRLALDYFWHGGNETTVNGVDRDDAWNDHAAQVTALWRLPGRRMLTVYYRNDFVVRTGPESQTVAVRLMQGF
jgi:hypothetical protein